MKTTSKLHFVQTYITECFNSKYFFMITEKAYKLKAYKTIPLSIFRQTEC